VCSWILLLGQLVVLVVMERRASSGVWREKEEEEEDEEKKKRMVVNTPGSGCRGASAMVQSRRRYEVLSLNLKLARNELPVLSFPLAHSLRLSPSGSPARALGKD
jgi:hypothetical protein